jgi:hypothetical protein
MTKLDPSIEKELRYIVSSAKAYLDNLVSELLGSEDPSAINVNIHVVTGKNMGNGFSGSVCHSWKWNHEDHEFPMLEEPSRRLSDE